MGERLPIKDFYLEQAARGRLSASTRNV